MFGPSKNSSGQQLKDFGRHDKVLIARILKYVIYEVVGAERASSRFESHYHTLEIWEGRFRNISKNRQAQQHVSDPGGSLVRALRVRTDILLLINQRIFHRGSEWW